MGKRRHSMSGYTQLEIGMRGLQVDMNLQHKQFEGINDYFDNSDHRTKAWVEAGKTLESQALKNQSLANNVHNQEYNQNSPTKEEPHNDQYPILVVEFKAGRRDFFFCDPPLVIRSGDLVIVEADRGKDLGKVICDNLMSMEQVAMYQHDHPDILSESPFSGKVIVPKKVYRKANVNEVGLVCFHLFSYHYLKSFIIIQLSPKSSDEQKAMEMCRGKIRGRKLPMEVVDAEYQW